MRQLTRAALTMAPFLLPFVMSGQVNNVNTPGLSITGYHFVREEFYSRTQSLVTYTVDLTNDGPAQPAVTATVLSTVTGLGISGQNVIRFLRVPANSVVTSKETFTLFVDRTVPFSFNNLLWRLQADKLISDVSVGKNLQVQATITLPEPAGSGGADITVTSSDPARVLLGPSGLQQITVHIAEGVTTGFVAVGGLDSAGTVAVTASGAGFTGTGIVTLSPTGFELSGPTGIGQNFTLGQGATALIGVIPVRLDAAGHVIEAQTYFMPSGSVTVHVSSSNPAAGTLAPGSVTIGAGTNAGVVTFTALNTGSTTISIDTPAGFNSPALGGSLVASVFGGPPTVTTIVGKGLEAVASISLGAPVQSGNTPITITSDDPTQLLLSATPDGFGSASITLNLPAFSTVTPDFYVYGLASSGTATYRASAVGLQPVKGTVALRPSGFILVGPGGIGTSSFFTTPQNGDTPLVVHSALLNTDGSFSATQAVAGGSAVNVEVVSSDKQVGAVTSSPVLIVGGSSSGQTAYHPLGSGTTTLSLKTPSGFVTPTQFQTITAIIPSRLLSLTGDAFNPVTIGKNLEIPGFINFPPQAVPLTVTLTSNNPAILKLANTATGAGSASIQVTIPAGSTMGLYYIQAFGSSGSASYTSSAPGFNTRVADQITLAPSGVVVFGPLGFLTFLHKPVPYNLSLANGPSHVIVSIGVLNPDGTFLGTEQLAGGEPLSVPLINSDSSISTVPQAALILPGEYSANLTLTPLKTGQTTITVTQPPGFTAPAHGFTILDQPFTSLDVKVSP